MEIMERGGNGKGGTKRKRTRSTTKVNGEEKATGGLSSIWQNANREKQSSEWNEVQCPICTRFVKQSKINEHLDNGCDEQVAKEGHSQISPINCGSKPRASEKSKMVIVIDDDENDECNNGFDKGNHGFREQEKAEVSSRVGAGNDESFDGLISVLMVETAKIDPELYNFRSCFNPFKNTFDTAITACENKDNGNFHGVEDLLLHSGKNSVVFLNESDQQNGTTCQKSPMSDINEEKCLDGSKVDTVPATMNKNHEEIRPFEDSSLVPIDNKSVSSENADDTKYDPYYWANFKFIIGNVLSDTSNSHLFDESDSGILDKFKSLNEASQHLFVRLFLRKNLWLKVDKLSYPKIGEDLKSICSDLIENGFLDDKNTLDDINEILALMSAPELQSLAKSLQLSKNGKGEKLVKKKDLKNAIINLGYSQKDILSFFSPNSKHSMMNSIIKRAKSVLGDCVKISQKPREVFNRCFSLFSLANYFFNDDDNVNSTLIFRILQINKGELVFPSYKISKTIAIFSSRIDSIKYVNAVLLEGEFQSAMENKDFDSALKIYKTAKPDVDIICPKLRNPLEKSMIYSTSLPIQLRRFSVEWVLFRICSKSVETLEKKFMYHEAVELLTLLLSQVTYCLRSRGAWWDRLVIDTERYLKDPNKTLDYIKIALSDPWVRTGVRLNLIERAKRICNAGKNKRLQHRLSDFQTEALEENREVTISAPIFLDTSSSHRTIFSWNETDKLDDSTDQSYAAVEEYTLSHYKKMGFPNGIHAEGSSYSFIFSLIFWDIIFMDVDDVFLGPYQVCPLDLYSDQFYETRKEAIDGKLQEIRNSTIEDLRDNVEKSWLKHKGEVCLGCNWNIFEGVEQVMDVVSCLKIPVIAGICELFCKDYKNRGSGMPDLLVWNPVSTKCKAVEVKGPGDRLSTKQIIWLNVLTSLGMDAEVCHVKGVGGKRRRFSKE